MMPPTAGPSSRAIAGRAVPKKALACGRSASGIRSGTMELAAGLKKALLVPTSAPRINRCHSASAPVTDSMPIAAIATARTTSAAIIRRRRSKWSLAQPPTSSIETCAPVQTSPTVAIAVGMLLRA
jgi:hypothetical protein